MKIFQNRTVHNILTALTAIFICVGLYIDKIGTDNALRYAVGKPLVAGLASVLILLVLMYFIPRKIFNIWIWFGSIFFLYALSLISSGPVKEGGWGVGFDRYQNAGIFGIYLLIINIAIVLVIWAVYSILYKKK